MPWLLLQSKPKNATVGNVTHAFDNALTPGSLVVAATKFGGSTAASITDPTGFSRDGFKNGTSSTSIIISRVTQPGDGNSYTWGNSSVQLGIELMEWMRAGVTPLDTASLGGSNASAATIQPGSITPALSGELFIVTASLGADMTAGTGAVDSGFTTMDAATFVRTVVGYKIKTDATAENPNCTWTTARACAAIMVAYKPGLGIVAPSRRIQTNLMRAR